MCEGLWPRLSAVSADCVRLVLRIAVSDYPYQRPQARAALRLGRPFGAERTRRSATPQADGTRCQFRPVRTIAHEPSPMDHGLNVFCSPPVAIELEPALQALDASLYLGEVVRLAAARTRGVVCIGGERRGRG